MKICLFRCKFLPKTAWWTKFEFSLIFPHFATFPSSKPFNISRWVPKLCYPPFRLVKCKEWGERRQNKRANNSPPAASGANRFGPRQSIQNRAIEKPSQLGDPKSVGAVTKGGFSWWKRKQPPKTATRLLGGLHTIRLKVFPASVPLLVRVVPKCAVCVVLFMNSIVVSEVTTGRGVKKVAAMAKTGPCGQWMEADQRSGENGAKIWREIGKFFSLLFSLKLTRLPI